MRKAVEVATPLPEAPSKVPVPPVISTWLVEVARAVQLIGSGWNAPPTGVAVTDTVPAANSYVDDSTPPDADVTWTLPTPVMGPPAMTVPGDCVGSSVKISVKDCCTET